MTIPKDFKLSQLVPKVRERLLNDPSFYSANIYRFYPNEALDYKTFISICGEADRSTEEVYSFDDVVDYLNRYLKITGEVDLGELNRKTGLLNCFSSEEIKKSTYYKSYPLRLSSSIVDELDRCGGAIELSTLYLGGSQGLEVFIKFDKPHTIDKKNIRVDGLEYQNLIRRKIAPYIRLRSNLESDLHELLDGKPVHPVPYAVLRYVREHGELPLKIGKDQTAENEMWATITSVYESSKSDENIVYFEDSRFVKRDLWKAYQETYAIKVLNFILRKSHESLESST